MIVMVLYFDICDIDKVSLSIFLNWFKFYYKNVFNDIFVE